MGTIIRAVWSEAYNACISVSPLHPPVRFCSGTQHWHRFCHAIFDWFPGVAPASNTGGTIHDLFIRDKAGPPLSLYAISTVTSPGLTLVVTGYIVQNKGWRWVRAQKLCIKVSLSKNPDILGLDDCFRRLLASCIHHTRNAAFGRSHGSISC